VRTGTTKVEPATGVALAASGAHRPLDLGPRTGLLGPLDLGPRTGLLGPLDLGPRTGPASGPAHPIADDGPTSEEDMSALQ